MKICIRDDDLCFYSNFEQFQEIYNELNIPVSISLVPFAVPNHGDKWPYGFNYSKDTPIPFYKNIKLVSGLKEGINNKKYEILLHGYNHMYKSINGKMVAETIWKTKKQLRSELKEGKSIIEKTLNTTITTFVAPSQQIGLKCLKIITKEKMNYSGIVISKLPSLSFNIILNRLIWHFSIKKYGYPLIGKIHYPSHQEHGIISFINYHRLVQYYNICKKHNWNMVIVVHYWDLLANKNKYEDFKKLVSFFKSENVSFGFLSNCWK